ncbi:MAG TPA: hypothetical protein VG435_08685 [Acidimicrobiales bacterium]|nr:hypothetical protein [Acidimicrobiales bacterium]
MEHLVRGVFADFVGATVFVTLVANGEQLPKLGFAAGLVVPLLDLLLVGRIVRIEAQLLLFCSALTGMFVVEPLEAVGLGATAGCVEEIKALTINWIKQWERAVGGDRRLVPRCGRPVGAEVWPLPFLLLVSVVRVRRGNSWRCFSVLGVTQIIRRSCLNALFAGRR